MKNDFYIGYLPKMPESFKRLIRPTAVILIVTAIGFGVLFALSQQPFARSFFEFGNVQEFAGTIQAEPVPFLLVEKEELNNGLPAFFRYPLVGEGKHGVADKVAEIDGMRVSLKGTLIYRDGLRMIEVVSDSVVPIPGDSPNIQTEETPKSLGRMTLRGEIIDSKCYLGVMNPGNQKTHRDCAVACLRGGVPALYVVKDGNGNTSELWLVSETGEAINEPILDYVAEPVEVDGRVTRQGDQLFFFIDPKKLRRLG